ncbi:hypothetical protein BGZ91_010321 [Linnemannia elongata]|nr:hypothetical protein BGZ91_010321 [Linnemannia elongata]
MHHFPGLIFSQAAPLASRKITPPITPPSATFPTTNIVPTTLATRAYASAYDAAPQVTLQDGDPDLSVELPVEEGEVLEESLVAELENLTFTTLMAANEVAADLSLQDRALTYEELQGEQEAFEEFANGFINLDA